MDTALAIGLAMAAGGLAVVAPWPVAAAAMAVALVLVRARLLAPWVAVVALGALALTAARAHRSVGGFDRSREAARDALGGPQRCEGDALVATQPVRLHDALRWDGVVTSLSCDGRAMPTPSRVRLYGGPIDLARGDRVELVAQLAALQLLRNDGLADPLPSAARAGVVYTGSALDVRIVRRSPGLAAWIDRARAAVRARIDATYAVDAASMGRALVLGESDLDPADDEAFRASGLAHLLAVSGTHLVVAVAGLVAALGALLKRIEALAARGDPLRVSSAIGALLAWIYADFAGGTGSAQRAAAMMSIVLVARALGRRGDAVRACGLALVAFASVDPLVAFDLSFVLSIGAALGLIALGRPLTSALARVVPARLAAPLATTASATLACAPILARIAPSLPLAGLAANLVAVPIGEAFALPLCLAHAVAAPLPPVERGLALAASGALLAVRWVARVAAAATWLALPVPPPTAWQVAAVTATIAFVWTARARAPALAAAVAALLVLEGLARRDGAPRGRLRVTFLDVGQGDSALIDFPDGRAMLVDGGGLVGSPLDTGRAVVLPALRARRRSRLDVAVLTHPHPDHFLGLASALPSIDVGAFWDTGQGEREGTGGAYADLLAGLRARGTPILGPDRLCGEPHRFGEAEVDVLAPCPGPLPDASANDSSFVLRVSLGSRAALLVGDAEHGEESRLLSASRERLRADALKIGHHGSRTSSTPAFVDAVAPTLALISCGVRNRFGHPHASTLTTLASRRIDVRRTDTDGAVVWETDGRDVWTRGIVGR